MNSDESLTFSSHRKMEKHIDIYQNKYLFYTVGILTYYYINLFNLLKITICVRFYKQILCSL